MPEPTDSAVQRASRTHEDLLRELNLLRERPVVSLRRFRALRIEVGRALARDLLGEIESEIRQLASSTCHMLGDALYEWIREQASEHGVPERRSVAWLAVWVAEHPYFWRESRKIRSWYAEFNEVPSSSVKPHVRAGSPVRAHRRLLGFEHLTNTVPPGDVVAEVVGHIVSAATRT
jgi:hypothetical protein